MVKSCENCRFLYSLVLYLVIVPFNFKLKYEKLYKNSLFSSTFYRVQVLLERLDFKKRTQKTGHNFN